MWCHPPVSSVVPGQARFALWKDCEILFPCLRIHFVPQSFVHDRVIFGHFLCNNLFPFPYCCHVVGLHFVEDTSGLYSLMTQPRRVVLVSLRQKLIDPELSPVADVSRIITSSTCRSGCPSSSPDTDFQSSSSSLMTMVALGKVQKPHRVRSRSPVPVPVPGPGPRPDRGFSRPNTQKFRSFC